MENKTIRHKSRKIAEPEEMCEQFTRLFGKQTNKYIGEQCLLQVLIRRGDDLQDDFEKPRTIRTPLPDDHARRRKMIFKILGLETFSNRSQLTSSNHETILT
ncbi:MAG: hypothetical protein QM762_16990 [Chryseolinea sp.]